MCEEQLSFICLFIKRATFLYVLSDERAVRKVQHRAAQIPRPFWAQTRRRRVDDHLGGGRIGGSGICKIAFMQDPQTNIVGPLAESAIMKYPPHQLHTRRWQRLQCHVTFVLPQTRHWPITCSAEAILRDVRFPVQQN